MQLTEPMPNSSDRSKRSRPVCGVISLVLPLAVAAIGWLAIQSIREGDSGSLGTYISVFYSATASAIVGMILAIVALFRHERWKGLPILTLSLDAIAAVLLVRFLIQ